MRPRITVQQLYPPPPDPSPPSRLVCALAWTLCGIIGAVGWVALVAATELALAWLGVRP